MSMMVFANLVLSYITHGLWPRNWHQCCHVSRFCMAETLSHLVMDYHPCNRLNLPRKHVLVPENHAGSAEFSSWTEGSRNFQWTRSEDLDTELPMTTTFSLEDALSQDSGAGALSTSSEFMRYILETRIPGVHYHHADDEAGASNVSSGAAAGSSPPRLVDGAHEDHMIPGNELQLERASNYAHVLKILRDQENISSTEKGELKVESFHSKSLDYLERNWIPLMKNLKGVEGKYNMLLSIADNLKALTPSNDPLPWDVLNMAKWKDSLWELIKEMKTVEESCSPSLLSAPGVYVLTATPYSAFLRALAAEIADKTYNEQRLYKAV